MLFIASFITNVQPYMFCRRNATSL